MSSAWSQLDQLLTCAICLDRYRNPKLLPCQHTFCMEPCLDGLIDYARRQIKCPECRAEHRIPYKGIQEFPTNVTLMRFLELHRDITGEEPEPPPSMMERCSVCSEKANLEKCAHCDKKICPDCKEAHIDILRREINRINNQVRRGLHRLADALAQTKKNAEKLQLNCGQVKDEIEDIVRRYSKDLKHTEEKLKHDLENYTETEMKAVNKLKEDLEAEVSNMTSNCDLVDKYIKDNSEWSDAELLEYKDIFLKTLDFLRSFDADSSDFSRRIKFQPRADPDVLHRNIADFGELKINAPPPSSMPMNQQSLAPPSSNALMRSQSDHRLAAQFARRTETRSFADRYGGHTSDNERESGRPTSPLYGRSRREVEGSGYRRYSDRNRDYDYERPNNRYLREDNSSSSVLGSRWRDGDDYGNRSRYNRDYDDYEPEPQHASRTVRFADEPNQRSRLFDVDSATKGPLSGVIKLMDSPIVMERLHQHEVRQKQTSEKETTTANPQLPKTDTRNPTPAMPPVPPQRKAPTREPSEDDIDRQKKANQQATTSSSAPSSQSTAPESPSRLPAKSEAAKPSLASRLPRKEAAVESPSVEVTPATDSSARSRKQPSMVEAAEESDSTSSTSSSRCTRPGLGKALATDGIESTPAQSLVDKKVTSNPTQLTALTKASDRRNESETKVSDEGSRPVQSSFFSRQRRLPDPEPRLLQSSEEDDDDEEDDSDEESEGEDEEEEEEEASDDRTVSSSNKTESNVVKPDNVESESEESSTETTSSESESEDSDDKDGNNTQSQVPTIQNQRFSTINSVDTNSNRLSSAPKYNKHNDITKNDGCEKNQNEFSTPGTTVGVNHKDECKHRNRRQSDDFDATDSSSGSSSTNYHSFSNTTPILSNGTMDDNMSSENSNANPPHKESRFAKKRPVLSRSRSSHELGLGYDASENADEEEDDNEEEEGNLNVLPNYRSRSERASADDGVVAPRSRPRFDHQTSVDSALSPTSSSWANYLKNKYSTNAAGRAVARSRSSHALFQRSDSDSSDDDAASGRESMLSGSMSYANPRSTYMQKRRMLFKFGTRGTEPGNFTWPRGVAVGPDDSIVVADSSNHRVQVFDSLGVFLFEFGSHGSCEGQFDCPSGVSVNRIGQYIVSDRYNQRVQLFDPAGRFLRAFGSEGRTDGRFNCPWGITTDSLGFIYVCDKENHRVQVFQSDGTFVGKFGVMGSRPGQLENPHYIAVSNTNRVVVSDSNNHRIQIFDVNGRTLSTFGSEGSSEGQFKFPRGVAVDDQGFIIVGDSGNNRIQIFHPDGSYLREFGTWGSGEREFKGLEGIAVTSAGNILVCDRENHRIQVF